MPDTATEDRPPISDATVEATQAARRAISIAIAAMERDLGAIDSDEKRVWHKNATAIRKHFEQAAISFGIAAHETKKPGMH